MTIAASQFGTGTVAKTRSELYPLDRATTWLNSPPLTDTTLQGKVTLVEFWTYSCINWRRQLPFVQAWAEKYGAQGLVVIGVRSPEFSFEKNIDNVRWAANDMRVIYPIAVDNDHAIWRGFNNEYWRHSIVLIQQERSDTANLERANTTNQRRSFKDCWPKPEIAAGITSWCPLTLAVPRLPLIGTTYNPVRTISAMHAPRTLHRVQRRTSLASILPPNTWN